MGAGISKHEDEIKLEHKNAAIKPNDSAATAAAVESTKGSGCPMKSKDGSYSFDIGAFFRPSFPHGPGGKKPISKEEARNLMTSSSPSTAPDAGGCPVKHQQHDTSVGDGCPVKHKEYNVYSQPIDPKNNMPSLANQKPAPGQKKALPTERVPSTIGKGGTNESTWTYPSPQMFYNALARKGKLGETDESDIVSVVALHNNMNEKTWRKVLEWESVLNNSDNDQRPPKLLKFMGRPSDLSPKALFKHYILGHPLPYDRHDWTVVRSDGSTIRYVIDYYHDETKAQDSASSAMPQLQDTAATPSLLVDVRPALDGPLDLYSRMVVMPYARRVEQSTAFEPLPMRPSISMRSQVDESLQVWDNIQAAVKEKEQEAQNNSDAENNITRPENVTRAQAKKLASSYATVMKECRSQQLAVDNSNDDDEATKTSMDLTMCLGQILCPIQHERLVKFVMMDDESVPVSENERQVEAALETMSECVLMQSAAQQAAKEKFPRLF